MGSEEKKSKKKLIIRITLLVVIVALIFVRFVIFSDTYNYDKIVTSRAEINSIIDTAISKGKGEIYFKSTIVPNGIDFDDIMKRNTEDGSYAGCELYALRYEYQQSREGFDVHVHLSEPSLFANFRAKLRVKLIASKFDDLNDYEKIKGVHDYLVLLNRYVAFEGGAYSALCKGRSSCSGYAFSFYAIMRELGVPVTVETGGNHAWNRVQYEGKWYNIDVTWDDNGVDEISYDYFMKCDADWRGHHHGGSDAETSIAPTGKSAHEYYSMVPNYNLIEDIALILIFVIPVVILGIHLYKKKKKEAPITEGKVMVAGNWSYLMPQEKDGRFEVLRRICTTPYVSDIWGYDNGVFYHERESTADNSHEKLEVPPAKFFEEVDFIITVCRGNKAPVLSDALQRAKFLLERGDYKYGDYSNPRDIRVAGQIYQP